MQPRHRQTAILTIGSIVTLALTGYLGTLAPTALSIGISVLTLAALLFIPFGFLGAYARPPHERAVIAPFLGTAALALALLTHTFNINTPVGGSGMLPAYFLLGIAIAIHTKRNTATEPT